MADYANAMPDQLSGGMRQRVAFGSNLMQDKPVVLRMNLSQRWMQYQGMLQSLACGLVQEIKPLC